MSLPLDEVMVYIAIGNVVEQKANVFPVIMSIIGGGGGGVIRRWRDTHSSDIAGYFLYKVKMIN